MLVNISRNKILINVPRDPKKNIKKSQIASCNHCGGALKNSLNTSSCIMCSREKGHICSNCNHAPLDIVE